MKSKRQKMFIIMILLLLTLFFHQQNITGRIREESKEMTIRINNEKRVKTYSTILTDNVQTHIGDQTKEPIHNSKRMDCRGNNNQENTKGDSSDPSTSLNTLASHDPIVITNDKDFETYNFTGTGIIEDPYIIEGYDIITTEQKAISINGTTKHFLITKCNIQTQKQGYYYGIYIKNVTSGTAKIIDNKLANNAYGVWIEKAAYSTITNNTLTDHSMYAIYIQHSDFSTMSTNKIYTTQNTGIYIHASSSTTIKGNEISKCPGNGGIYVMNSHSTLLKDNIVYQSGYGINIFDSTNNNLVNNTVQSSWDAIFVMDSNANTLVNNTIRWCDLGIYLSASSSNTIHYNSITECENYGLFISAASLNNIVYLNKFKDNGVIKPQGYDDGTDNLWYNETLKKGNYWSDWDGYGPYAIDGNAGSEDIYPLAFPGEENGEKDDENSSQTEKSLYGSMLVITLAMVFGGMITLKYHDKKKGEYTN